MDSIQEHVVSMKATVDEVLLVTARKVASVMRSLGVEPPADDVLSFSLLVTIVFGVLLLFVLLVSIFRSKSGSRNRRDLVVIAGRSALKHEPAVGKTALFKQLKNGEQVNGSAWKKQG